MGMFNDSGDGFGTGQQGWGGDQTSLEGDGGGWGDRYNTGEGFGGHHNGDGELYLPGFGDGMED